MDDEDHREALRHQIRMAALELLGLEKVPGLAFRLDNTRSVYIGLAPEMITDRATMSVSINGEACYTAEELWKAAWRPSEYR